MNRNGRMREGDVLCCDIFAFFDTVTDSFIEFRGITIFDNWSDFCVWYDSDKYPQHSLERFINVFCTSDERKSEGEMDLQALRDLLVDNQEWNTLFGKVNDAIVSMGTFQEPLDASLFDLTHGQWSHERSKRAVIAVLDWLIMRQGISGDALGIKEGGKLHDLKPRSPPITDDMGDVVLPLTLGVGRLGGL